MNTAHAVNPESWVEAHADALFAFALQRVRSREHAEDLVQETFVAALESRASFGGRSAERTWLVGILKHRIADHARSAARTPAATADELDAAAAAGNFLPNGKWKRPVAEWSDPARAFEQREFWAVFERCLSGLPDRVAAALTLRDIDGLNSDEVCEILGVSATNLWTLLYRGRLRLGRCLDAHWFNRTE